MRVRPPVPFGQYVPIDSPVHRLEPRAKMALVAAYTILLFSADGFGGLALGAAVMAVAVTVSRVPWRLVVRGVRGVTFLLVFTVLAHAIRISPATVALVRFGPVAVDGQGLRTGTFFALRIVLLVLGTALLTLTTSPVRLTDALERILSPLSLARVPVADLAMMLTIALRFIPTTAEEAEKIIIAQTARGARFDRGGLIGRAKAYVPVLVPLFVNLFRRADDLAMAMEARCYRGGAGRTKYYESHFHGSDWAVMVLGCTLLVVGAVLL